MTRSPDVLTFGEAMVSFRSAGPIALGGLFTGHVAGAESNVAIGLARLGHTVEWAGRVSGDELGELVLRELRAEGVRLGHVTRDPGRPTGVMFLEQRVADVARVVYNRAGSAASALAPTDLEAALAQGPRILHLSGITPALSPSAREATLWAARAAAAAGVTVCLDVNFRSKLWSRPEATQTLARIVAHVDVVIASDDELDLVAGGAHDERTVVEVLHASGVQQVMVKRGAAGATVHTVTGSLDEPARAVRVVDTVGAGDAFSAGVLSGILDGLDPEGCLRRGVLLGGFCVGTQGDWEGLPRRDELTLLDDHPAGSALR